MKCGCQLRQQHLEIRVASVASGKFGFMATEKQIVANRLNSEKSTGPTTAEGKAAVRFNAVKHGLLARGFLPGEHQDAFDQLHRSLTEDRKPVGALEILAVDRIVECFWRLRRFSEVEEGLFLSDIYAAEARQARAEAARYLTYPDDDLYKLYEQAQVRGAPQISDETGYHAAIERAEEAERRCAESVSVLGAAFSRDASGPNAFLKLSRYETSIDRSLHRFLDELRRLQADRRSASKSRVSGAGDIIDGDDYDSGGPTDAA